MGIYQDCPFEHHCLDEPEGDRDRAVTPERDIVTDYLCERIRHLINSDSRSERSGRFFLFDLLAVVYS